MRFLRAGLAAAVVFSVGLTMTAQPAYAALETWTKMEVTTKLYPRTAATNQPNAAAAIGPVNPDLNGPSKAHLDPQLRADLAEQMRHPQTYNSGPASQNAVAATEDWMTLDQCKTGWAAQPSSESWFYRNHFSACQINMNIAAFYTCSTTGCTESGRATVGIAFLGELSHTTRSFAWKVYPFFWNLSGTADLSRVMSIEMACGTYADGGVCNANPMWGYHKTLADWRVTTSVTFSYSTSTTPVAGDPRPLDKISHFKFAPSVQFEGPTTQPVYPFTVVRCDNASYVTGAGCTFTGVMGTFDFVYGYENYRESVDFVWTALYHLDRLIPNPTGLYVPGGDFVQPVTGYKEPLTRNYYGNTSRTKVVAECVRIYGENYTQRDDGLKNDCDEYPFASTYQNANYDTSGTAATWVVKPVNLSHNRSAGSILGLWYTKDHLLDGDAFFVHIANAPAD